MSNSEIFLTPANWLCGFLLSLFNLTPAQLDPSIYQMLVIVLAIFLWAKFISACLSIVKRTFGFGR